MKTKLNKWTRMKSKKSKLDKIPNFKFNKEILTSSQESYFPNGLVLKRSSLPHQVAGIFTALEIKKDTIFGPYFGEVLFDDGEACLNAFCWDVSWDL